MKYNYYHFTLIKSLGINYNNQYLIILIQYNTLIIQISRVSENNENKSEYSNNIHYLYVISTYNFKKMKKYQY